MFGFPLVRVQHKCNSCWAWVGPIPDLMLELSSNDGSGSLDLSLNFTELVLDVWVRKFTFLVLAWVGHVWFLSGLVQLDPDSILVGP